MPLRLPYITFNGVQYPALEARITILNTSDDPLPICEFAIKLAVAHDTTLAKWALSPVGNTHLNLIELDISDSSRRYDRHWTLQRAYVRDYEEMDPPADYDPTSANVFYYQVFVRGTLAPKLSYNGTNILSVAVLGSRPGGGR